MEDHIRVQLMDQARIIAGSNATAEGVVAVYWKLYGAVVAAKQPQ